MPNTLEITSVPIRNLASGNTLTFPVYTFNGTPGEKVYIQANIHGPEISGIGLIHRLIEILKMKPDIYGTVVLVPSVNPVALDYKVNGLQVAFSDPYETYSSGHFNLIYQLPMGRSSSEDGLNSDVVAFARQHLGLSASETELSYKSWLIQALHKLRKEREPWGVKFSIQLALAVQSLMQDADYVIDLHTGEKGCLFAYTFPHCLESFSYFGIPLAITLGNGFAGVLDEAFMVPWLMLESVFAQLGREISFEKEFFTLELGDMDNLHVESIEQNVQKIMNYLHYKGILQGTSQPSQTPFSVSDINNLEEYYAPTGGLIYWAVEPGDFVSAEDIIYRLNSPQQDKLPSHLEVRAVTSGIIINICFSHVVHQGMNVCTIATDVRSEK